MLLARQYPNRIINSSISKARLIPRDKALKYVSRIKLNTRPVFMVSWDPRLPSILDLTKKHWRSMKGQDPYFKEFFPDPPLVAFKRQRNIRDKIRRAKIPTEQSRNKIIISGMKKCGKCSVCPYVKLKKEIKSKLNPLFGH